MVDNDYLVKLPFTKNEGLKHDILSSWPSIRQFSHGLEVKPYQLESIKMLCKHIKREHYMTFLFLKLKHRPICESK